MLNAIERNTMRDNDSPLTDSNNIDHKVIVPPPRKMSLEEHYSEERLSKATPFGRVVLEALRDQRRSLSNLYSALGIHRDYLNKILNGMTSTIYLRHVVIMSRTLNLPLARLIALIYGAEADQEARTIALLDRFLHLTDEQQEVVLSMTSALASTSGRELPEGEHEKASLQPAPAGPDRPRWASIIAKRQQEEMEQEKEEQEE